MLLPRDSAMQFIDGYKAVMLQVLAAADLPSTDSITQDMANARTHAMSEPGSIERAMEAIANRGEHLPLTVAAAIRSLRVCRWIYLRHTRSFAVFLDEALENAYEVRALTTPLNELIDEPPMVFEAGLFIYEGLFVCDGIVLEPVLLGAGYAAEFKAAYTALRQAGKLHRKAPG